MSKRCTAAACLAVVLLALIACGRGNQPAPKQPPPARIISIVPAVTEMLFAIGAGPRLVAVSSFDHWPPDAEKLAKVGGLLDPDIEKIISLRPDLLVVDASQAEVIAKAEGAGIRVYRYRLGGLDNVARTMRELGQIEGMQSQGEAAARGVEHRLEAIRARVAGRPRPRTVLVFGREPGALRAIDVSGGVGFLHDIVQLAGGDNVFGSEKREWVRVSVESILAAAPEVVVELHYGYHLTPARLRTEMAVWKGLPALPAVRANRIYLLEGDKYVVPGPRVIEAAEEVAAVIQGVKK